MARPIAGTQTGSKIGSKCESPNKSNGPALSAHNLAEGAFEADAAAAGIAVRPVPTATLGDEPPTFRDREGRKLVFMQSSFQHF
jgi:hypothetical protein